MFQSQSLRYGVGENMGKKEMPQITKTSIHSKNMLLILHSWVSRSSPETALASRKGDTHIGPVKRDFL